MTDATLNRFLSEGTHAQRLAFTPSPPTPASGPAQAYFWLETDTGLAFAWNQTTTAWVALGGGLPNAIANSKLLGSGTAGAGAPYAELTLGTGLTMSGTTLNAAASTPTTGDLLPLTPPPPVGSFTAFNSPTSFTSVAGVGSLLDGGVMVATTDNNRGYFVAPPATPWQATCRCWPSMNFAAGFPAYGMFVGDGTKLVTLTRGYDPSKTDFASVINWTNPSTFSGFVISANDFNPTEMMRIKNDGTNLFYQLSYDNNTWTTFAKTLIGSFLGAITRVGLVVNTSGGNANNEHCFATYPYWDLH